MGATYHKWEWEGRARSRQQLLVQNSKKWSHTLHNSIIPTSPAAPRIFNCIASEIIKEYDEIRENTMHGRAGAEIKKENGNLYAQNKNGKEFGK